MGAIAGKPKKNDNESNRKRQNPDSRLSSSRRREVHQRLLNETIEQNEAPSNTTLNDLPLEMLDIILQKSYLHWILNASTKQRDKVVIRSLISVDVCFYRRITRQRFKKAIWRYLQVVCPISINFTQKIQMRGNAKVHGVTKLRNEIYILCRASMRSLNDAPSIIRVFEDRNPFRLHKLIEIKEIEFPWEIGNNARENCLYVWDGLAKCIFKITGVTDNEHKIIKWLTFDYALSSLSMSTDGQSFVVSDSSSILRIYGSDAELIKSIQLPRDIEIPIHAMETSIGNFIILHEWMEKKEREWGICELTRDGQMAIRRFIPLNETQKLKNPRYFSLDSDDRVFVADSGNDRVILFGSDLKWNQVLCPRKETNIKDPWILCYDEEKKQLVVGSYFDNEINVYTLSRN